ncbi:MAG TPA: SDR family NAD(P)-dependent oxidoreductase [Frankiaceae bacterium]|nr:SDR family NAD(P)-dependent oxidoreductase [Frankiaceae bacterium]
MTGAAQGIGRAYAEAFAGEGASVVVADIAAAAAGDVAAQIEASGGTALGVEVDVADDDAVRAMVDACVERFASS